MPKIFKPWRLHWSDPESQVPPHGVQEPGKSSCFSRAPDAVVSNVFTVLSCFPCESAWKLGSSRTSIDLRWSSLVVGNSSGENLHYAAAHRVLMGSGMTRRLYSEGVLVTSVYLLLVHFQYQEWYWLFSWDSALASRAQRWPRDWLIVSCALEYLASKLLLTVTRG